MIWLKGYEEMSSIRAVFLDRDGVINEDSPDYITSPDQIHILPGVQEAISKLNKAGFLVIVASNQSGIGRGYMSEATFHLINDKIREELSVYGAKIDAFYFCPHTPSQNCSCRKPKSGLLLRASREYGINLDESYMVGDKHSDIACGESAGCATILVLSGQTRGYDRLSFSVMPDYICLNLNAASDWIIERP
jgi:D-glycero-D-manno-heptose 1,7-bisphosphate phosphatase